MTELRAIETEPGLVFDVLIDGPADGPLVLLLHGFAELFHMWRAQSPALAAAGYRAVAPSQRGYSAGARPNSAELANYQFDRLLDDALAIVAACGRGSGRFHLVGHDWGAGIAWGLADRNADRIASLTVVVASPSQRLQPRVVHAGRRTGTSLAASQGISRAGRSRESTGG